MKPCPKYTHTQTHTLGTFNGQRKDSHCFEVSSKHVSHRVLAEFGRRKVQLHGSLQPPWDFHAGETSQVLSRPGGRNAYQA